MGHLIYGVAPAIDIEDRALEHLRVVIVTKLRRNESFSFNWDNEPDVAGDDATRGSGLHGTVWISKASSLYFSFDTAPTDPLNPQWVKALMESANSNRGLRLVPEPAGP
jgi:hypothetical protein